MPLGRNAKARIEAYVKAYNARNKQPRQHCGPITHAFQRELKALLWAFITAALAAASLVMRRSRLRRSASAARSQRR